MSKTSDTAGGDSWGDSDDEAATAPGNKVRAAGRVKSCTLCDMMPNSFGGVHPARIKSPEMGLSRNLLPPCIFHLLTFALKESEVTTNIFLCSAACAHVTERSNPCAVQNLRAAHQSAKE